MEVRDSVYPRDSLLLPGCQEEMNETGQESRGLRHTAVGPTGEVVESEIVCLRVD